ncbi:MAG: hypothetical protein AB2448_01810 [Moorella sp. (in: firmicutes)]
MRINFSSEDIIRNRNYADLLEYGDFVAEYLEIDVDGVEDLDVPIDGFTAVGEWRRYTEDGHISAPGILTITQAEFENAPSYRDVLEGRVTAGRIFNCGWLDWTIEEDEHV